jgi:anti-sigma B factor antagonist
MDFEITKLFDYTLVKVLNDRLDINNALDLKSELVVINAEGEKNLVLDLSQCAYCDSAGLNAILVANLLCENALGTFILTGLQPDVEQIIRISMLHTVLVITRTLEEAELILNEKSENTI